MKNRWSDRGRRSRSRARRLALERLDARRVMTSDLEAWDNAAALTLSFAPDGTPVAGHDSDLSATFQSLGSEAAWRSAVARAFQTWAQYANVNLGVVADDGTPFGARGLTHGDARFGDVRVAGIPMSSDTWAAAVDERRLFAGSWTGDTFFNTDATWSSLDDLFAAALHEAGHVLGLPHSADPLSPMFKHGIVENTTPTVDDIALLQQLYGARVPDEHERGDPNDTRGKATSFDHAEADDGFDGSIPLVEFGDLHATTDSDFYQLPVLLGYSGSLTIEVRTAGLSLLQPRITAYDRHGNELATNVSTDAMGGVARVTVSGPFDEKIYMRVDSVAEPLLAVGGYALVVRYDLLDTTSASVVEAAVREGFRWRGLTDDSLANINLTPLLRGDDDAVYDDDLSSDDDSSSGRTLDPVTDNANRRKFQYVGTIATNGDVDHYRLEAPTFDSSAVRNLTVSVEALRLDGVIASVTVLDDKGQLLPSETLANGAGLVMLFLPNVRSNGEYTIAIRTDSTAPGTDVGNYALTATFDTTSPDFQTLTAGTVSAADPTAEFTLYVARTQLFSFAFSTQAAAGSDGSIVWATILDSANRPVFTAAAPMGETRSGVSALLAPGEYHLLIAGRLPDGLTPAEFDFTFRGRPSSDPVGPPVVDPGSTPAYSCPAGDPNPYCYPGGVTTSDPFVTVPGAPPTPGTGNNVVSDPGDGWFWNSDFTRTNPINPLDVTPDGIIAPIDALLVINFLNANPTGELPIPPVPLPYLDVNFDGVAAPIDALLIINELNSLVNPEGEFVDPSELSASVSATSGPALGAADAASNSGAGGGAETANPVGGGAPNGAATVSAGDDEGLRGLWDALWRRIARRRRRG